MSCVFCDIVAGRAKAEIVAETPDLVAIRDIHPLAPGHLLVIPKRHFADARDCDEETLGLLVAEARRQGNLAVENKGATGYNIVSSSGASAQQTVFHLHFHLIPRREGDGLSLSFRGRGGAGA